MSNNIFREVYLRQVAGRLSTLYVQAGKRTPNGFDTIQEYAYFKAISGCEQCYLCDRAAYIVVKGCHGDFTGMETSGSIEFICAHGVGIDSDEEFTTWINEVVAMHGNEPIGPALVEILYWSEVYDAMIATG